MLKLSRNTRKKDDSAAAAPQGITASGSTVLMLAAQGLLLALVPLLLGFAYLILVREPQLRQQQVDRIAAAYADQQASNIHHLQQRLRARLESAAKSPLAQSAIAARPGQDAELVEQAMLDYFPEVISLRVIALDDLGTATLSSGSQGLRNHIEVDLVRRTAAGSPTEPEAYRFEGSWLTSFAELVAHPRKTDQRGVLIVTVDNRLLGRELASLRPDAGRFELEQRIGSAAQADTIAAAGAASSRASAQRATVNGTPWTVAFTPSDMLLASTGSPRTPLLLTLLLCAAGAIGGLLLPLYQYRRSLASEVDTIIAAADKKTPLRLRFPEMVTLAKQLRRATLRTLRPRAASVDSSPGSGLSQLESADPLFHGTGILVEEDEALLELDGDTAPAGERPAPPPAGRFPAHIFRAYDIRGQAEPELSNELVAAVGGAIGTIAGERGEQTLVVGCDGRDSSDRIKSTLIRALMEAGRDVIDIGLVSTPQLYYATHKLQSRSGVMVTGSHNPPEYNGLKIVIDRHTLAAGGIQEIHALAEAGNFSTGSGRMIREDITGRYVDEIVDDVAVPVPLKIVVDAGNGATAAIAPTLFEEIGCEVIPLYCKVDGSFPNRPPDTSNEDNLSDLIAAVLQHEADLGVAFDGDGDRVAVVTASGQIVRTDMLMMLFARDVVSRNPGADVVFDVKCSRNLASVISESGGRPVLWKTGHAYMKEKMLETGALLGGEFSGHIFFGERWFGFDDGMYAAARLAEILSTCGESLDEALSSLPSAVNTPEILVPVEEHYKFQLMDAIIAAADFPDGRVNTLDGLRVDFADGWGLLRASNTGPALTARFEAEDEAALEAVKTRFRELVDRVDRSIELPF